MTTATTAARIPTTATIHRGPFVSFLPSFGAQSDHSWRWGDNVFAAHGSKPCAPKIMKWNKPWPLVSALCALLFLAKLFWTSLSPTSDHSPNLPLVSQESWLSRQQSTSPRITSNGIAKHASPHHPIKELESSALRSFRTLAASQSKTLRDAVKEYQRRYGIPPPPHFDKWYSFAKSRNLQLMDEFDVIHDSLLPFWALEPVAIRSRVTEALGYEPNGLITVQLRDGEIARLEGGPDWQMEVMANMLKEFVHVLPDMDLAFNLHDEPRIVVPHDELSEMVRIAKDEAMAVAASNKHPSNSFSPRPSDVDDGQRRLKIPLSSRFNEYQHQSVWVPSRLSCSPDSPARNFREHVQDDTKGYASGQLGFVNNHTALSDICSAPSLRNCFGFFQRANAFKVSHELIPIFSQSKLSSFQDILYPSPWYHYGKIVTDQPAETHELQYDESMDADWDDKNNTLWWRGSTTGGFSREGGWRHQHRQMFVGRINGQEDGKILSDKGSPKESRWQLEQVSRSNYSELTDIHFSGVGQCDPGDCAAQREYFDMALPVSSQEAWKYKFLLDMDGNAFSGRFYSFLRSKSLPFKLSLFREWHQDWLKPWVHYVPLSLRGDEHLEAVRYLATDNEGMAIAPRLAMQGREWAGKALRNEDLEAWFFRLLLEYARVIDDNRESIGFTL